MLKKNKQSFQDKFNNISYYDITDVKESIETNSTKEYRVPKTLYIFIIVAMTVIGFSGLRECIISPEILSDRTFLISSIGLVVTSGIIYSTVKLIKNEIILKLTLESIEHKGAVISWSSISNLKIKSQYDGDSYNYDLILCSDKNDISISIDNLSSDHKEISKEVAKYFWNWKSRTLKNPSNRVDGREQ